MAKIGIQLLTLRELDDPLSDVITRVGETGFEGIEFTEWAYPLLDADQSEIDAVAESLRSTGLEPISALVTLDGLHDPSTFKEGMAKYERAAQIYGQLGVDTFVLPKLPADHFESEAAVNRTADRLIKLTELLGEYDADLLYHNHYEAEFVDLGERTAIELLIEEVDGNVGFEFDIAWITVGGKQATDFIARYGGDPAPIIHLKDVDITAESDREIGTGDVDMQSIANASIDANVEWLVYEYERPTDPIESLNHGAETLISLRDGYHR